MFLLVQLWSYLFMACVLGAVAALSLRRYCVARSAPHDEVVQSLEQSLQRMRTQAVSLEKRLAECERGLTSATSQLEEAEQALNDRTVKLTKADQEIEALRRQIAQSRAELARVLNSRDVDGDTARAELAATRALLQGLPAR